MTPILLVEIISALVGLVCLGAYRSLHLRTAQPHAR